MSVARVLQRAAEGTSLSFVYRGGSAPGTRRNVTYLCPWQLVDGKQGFRAMDGQIEKTYRLSLCEAMHIVEQDTTDEDDADADDLREQLRDLREQLRELKRRVDQGAGGSRKRSRRE